MPGFGTVKRARVGKMRHRVWIEYKLYADAEADQVTARGRAKYIWTRFVPDRVPCAIEQLYGREREQARQLVANASHRVTMRYIDGVTRQMRLNLGGRLLYVGDIDNLEESNRFLVLTCEERV